MLSFTGISFITIFKNKPNYVVCLAKLVVFPIIGIALALLFTLLLPDEKFNLAMCSLICFATPTPALASTFGDQYGGDTENAVIYTLGTTILSVITIPLLYMALVAIL
jgi:predicted permease